MPVEIGESSEPIPIHFAYRRDINVEAGLSAGANRCIGISKGRGCYALRSQYWVHVADQISPDRPESMLPKFFRWLKCLIDENFTLADVAWTPQAHRMSLMEWPMTSYSYLSRWYARLQKRPSFQQAVVDCEPPGARAMFASYAAQRRRERTSVADLLNNLAA